MQTLFRTTVSPSRMPFFDTLPSFPLDVTKDTMTTCGRRVGELPWRLVDEQNLRGPVAVGQDQDQSYVYPVFPTWGFFAIAWEDAGRLAKMLVEAHALSMQAVMRLPRDSIVARLLHASFPIQDLLETANDDGDPRQLWENHLGALLFPHTVSEEAYTSDLVLTRAEAARLAKMLAASAQVVEMAAVPATRDGALLRALAAFAAPTLLFEATAHGRLAAQRIQDEVLREGEQALPDTLRVPVGAPRAQPAA